MIADDEYPAAGLYLLDSGLERLLQDLQLIVHGHAQRLKGPGGRIFVGMVMSRRAIDPLNQLRELGGRGEGILQTIPDDGMGYLLGFRFFTIVEKDSSQGFLVPGIDDLCRCQAVEGVHAHVQGALMAMRETTFGLIEVWRGDSEVEEEAIEAYSLLPQPAAEISEVQVDCSETFTEGLKSLLGTLETARVLVDADDGSPEVWGS